MSASAKMRRLRDALSAWLFRCSAKSERRRGLFPALLNERIWFLRGLSWTCGPRRPGYRERLARSNCTQRRSGRAGRGPAEPHGAYIPKSTLPAAFGASSIGRMLGSICQYISTPMCRNIWQRWRRGRARRSPTWPTLCRKTSPSLKPGNRTPHPSARMLNAPVAILATLRRGASILPGCWQHCWTCL